MYVCETDLYSDVRDVCEKKKEKRINMSVTILELTRVKYRK